MACTTYNNSTEAILDVAFGQAIKCYYVDPLGETGAAFLLFGAIAVGMTGYYQRIEPMLVLVIALGAVAIPYMPAGVATVFGLALVVGGAALVAVIYRRIRTP